MQWQNILYKIQHHINQEACHMASIWLEMIFRITCKLYSMVLVSWEVSYWSWEVPRKTKVFILQWPPIIPKQISTVAVSPHNFVLLQLWLRKTFVFKHCQVFVFFNLTIWHSSFKFHLDVLMAYKAWNIMLT